MIGSPVAESQWTNADFPLHPSWQKNAAISKYTEHVVDLRTTFRPKHRRMIKYIQMI